MKNLLEHQPGERKRESLLHIAALVQWQIEDWKRLKRGKLQVVSRTTQMWWLLALFWLSLPRWYLRAPRIKKPGRRPLTENDVMNAMATASDEKTVQQCLKRSIHCDKSFWSPEPCACLAVLLNWSPAHMVFPFTISSEDSHSMLELGVILLSLLECKNREVWHQGVEDWTPVPCRIRSLKDHIDLHGLYWW